MKYDKNLVHYVSATVILSKDGKFLIARRADWEKVFPGRWTVPGGKLEVLDYALREKDSKYQWYNILEDLARSEIKEEVGLEIKNIDYVTSLVYVRPDKVPCLVISFWAEPVGERIKLCSALTDFKWVNLEEAKNYDLIEGIYEELEMLDKKLKTGKMDEWSKNLSDERAFSSTEENTKREGVSY